MQLPYTFLSLEARIVSPSSVRLIIVSYIETCRTVDLEIYMISRAATPKALIETFTSKVLYSVDFLPPASIDRSEIRKRIKRRSLRKKTAELFIRFIIMGLKG